MKELVFVTNNKHKLEEVRAMLKNRFKVLSLSDISCSEDIAETADTFEGNALLKAEYVYKKYGLSCFADDSGLEVAALNGAPGVKSARYAGETKNSLDNIQKLLQELQGVQNRSACFRTVIALMMDDQVHYFDGKICGTITEKPRGSGGFGYDSVFVPETYLSTFAQLRPEEKNKISHRAIAINKLISHLNKNSE